MKKKSTNKKLKFIGLTGGICCGKTEVAEMFITLDARVIDADRISRELTKPYKPAWKEIVKSFGREFLLPDENLDRKKIAGEVFKNKKEEALLRLKSQMPVSEKIRFADYLVDNSGSKAMTFKTVKKIFSELS